MTDRPTRIVDAHVHLWDPARTDWYPYLSGRMEIGMGDVSTMARRFDVATHRSESAGWPVEKLVHVAAAVGRHSIDETLELGRRADGEGPDAIVGGVVPSDTVAEAIELIDRQAAVPRFRGVRPMGGGPPVPPVEVLAALAERGLVFELMAHPDQLQDAAAVLAGVDGLSVVVEHTGWPRDGSDEERTLWLDGMQALADVGERVACKLSGLAMPLASVQPDVLAPWIEGAIELFGADRCLFASNFPVDGMHCTLDELFSSYATIVSGVDAASRDALFAGTAERVYGLT
jgi:predicted TIM-barrel fold metal-dependent hydrolase